MFFRGSRGLLYVDRGDRNAYDFQLANITCDNNWHELDISALIPNNAKMVRGYIEVRSSAASGHVFGVDESGKSNHYTAYWINQIMNDVWVQGGFELSVLSNKSIAYRGKNTITYFQLVIQGWWV